jgi:hypothetical protein
MLRCCQSAITVFEKWELTVESPWRQGLLTGEHGRNFRPIQLEGKNPPGKWAYCTSLMFAHHCASFLMESGSVIAVTMR